jgi:membrane-associated phospholipid phosphatase
MTVTPIERREPATLRHWALGFLATVIMVVVAYYWLDRPIALLAHGELGNYKFFDYLTRIPEMLAPIGVVAFAALGLHAAVKRALTKLETVVLLCGISLTMAGAVKDQLKYVFGRTWPDTWINRNLSFIHDGVYGFNPFHGGTGYASFPSGHTTAICAVMSVLWICYPQFKIIYMALIAAVAIGLLGANFHFLGDIIAGGFLGLTTGWLIVVIWETGARHIRMHSRTD